MQQRQGDNDQHLWPINHLEYWNPTKNNPFPVEPVAVCEVHKLGWKLSGRAIAQAMLYLGNREIPR